MSGDGAHQGVSADRAIRTILGGSPEPAEEEQRNPDEMRAWLLTAPTVVEFEAYLDEISDRDYTDADYGQCARVAARVILESFLADPSLAAAPVETSYDWDADPDRGSKGMKPEYTISRGLDVRLKDRGVVLPAGMSGFQWGWAANAARYCVELPPEPNPAIIEV